MTSDIYSLDLYERLGVSTTCETKDIKHAYNKLAKKYHPDKGGDADVFNLIKEAYETLNNSEKRTKYDKTYRVVKQAQADFESLKKASKDYWSSLEINETNKETDEIDETNENTIGNKSVKSNKSDKSCKSDKSDTSTSINKERSNNDQRKKKQKDDTQKKKISAQTFQKFNEDMNKKRKMQPNYAPLSADDVSKKIEQMMLERKKMEEETVPDNLFEGANFNEQRFNDAFEEYNKHNSKRDLIIHKGAPKPWTSSNDDYYCKIENIENVFVEESEEDDERNVLDDIFGAAKKMTKEELRKLPTSSKSQKHDYKDANYQTSLEARIKSRNDETLKLKNLTEFKGDYDEYGLTNNLGIDADIMEELLKNQQKIKSSKK